MTDRAGWDSAGDSRARILLWFNLKTDADDDVLGFTSDWINTFAGRFDRILVVTMESGTIRVAPNVEVFSLGKEKGYSEARRLIRFYRLVGSLLTRHRIDGCFAHMTPLFAVLAFPLLWLRRVPLTLWYAHKSVTPMLRLAEKLVDRVVTPSPESFRIPSRKVRVVGHGINTSRFTVTARGRREPSFQVVSVGRLSRIKQVDVVIRAFAQAAESAPGADMRLVLVGGPASVSDERYVGTLRELVDQLNLGDRVHFSGNIPYARVAQYYETASCFVNLSNTGSVDKAVLEAMCCGVPVITSNEAFAGILRDVEPGLCYVMGQVKSVADALQTLAAMPSADRSSLGLRLRELAVRDHGLERLAGLLSSQLIVRI